MHACTHSHKVNIFSLNIRALLVVLCRDSCIDVLVYDRRRAGQDNGFAISTRPTNKGGSVGSERCPFSFSNLVSGAGARTGTSVCLGSAISQQRRWLDMREKFSKSGPLLISEFPPCPPSSQLWLQFAGCTCCKGPPPHFNRSLSSLFFISPPLLSCLAPFGLSACKYISKQSMVDAVCCPAIFHGNGARLPEEELPLNISGIHAVWTTHTACRLDGILVGGSRCGAL